MTQVSIIPASAPPGQAQPRAHDPWALPGRPKVGRPFPRAPLFGALVFVLFAIAATIFGRVTEIGTVRNPSTSPTSIRDIRFVEHANDEIAVVDAMSGTTIETILPEKDGFIRGALRGLTRDRRVRGGDADAAYRLILWDNGRLTLSDTSTGQRIELNAFGPTNAGALARFLPKGE